MCLDQTRDPPRDHKPTKCTVEELPQNFVLKKVKCLHQATSQKKKKAGTCSCWLPSLILSSTFPLYIVCFSWTPWHYCEDFVIFEKWNFFFLIVWEFPSISPSSIEDFQRALASWVEHLVVTKMARKRDHGQQKKIRSSWTTSKSMGMEVGELCPRMLVSIPSSYSFLLEIELICCIKLHENCFFFEEICDWIYQFIVTSVYRPCEVR